MGEAISFLLETALRDDGGRLITGQNPYSVSQTAEAVVKALGRPVKKRNLCSDERSWAGQELATREGAYDIPLIAIWGYYRVMAAGDDQAGLRTGLSVMTLAEPYFPEPQLKASISDACGKLASSER